MHNKAMLLKANCLAKKRQSVVFSKLRRYASNMDMVRASVILLFLLIPKAVFAVGMPEGFSLLDGRQPIHSTLGFSFVPPSGSDWYEKFGEKGITYLKKTNPRYLSFYAGAIEGEMRTAIADNDELLDFVKSKKDQWGSKTGRYRNVSSKFMVAENIGPFCVDYELLAEDLKAKNLGNNEFLIMTVRGVFCLHPNNKGHAVDIYYSVRSIPALDFSSLMEEGEGFVRSLQFIPGQGD